MTLSLEVETWLLTRPFIISRGSRTHAYVVVATLEAEGARGRGEGVPTPRYGESVEKVVQELEAAAANLASGQSLEGILAQMPPGAARNALDCAWWDWQCKKAGRRINALAGLAEPHNLITAYTLSLEEPAAMEKAAAEQAWRPILKVKSGRDKIIDCVKAVRQGAPQSTLLIDANEAWEAAQLPALLPALAECGVAMIEQPLPAGQDEVLAQLDRIIPIFADESFHTAADVERCAERYDGVNIKLDKTGGFSEALRALQAARQYDLKIFCGCMVGTSLSMAPAMIIAQQANYVDLDAPLLLASDRAEGITYDGSTMKPFLSELWG